MVPRGWMPTACPSTCGRNLTGSWKPITILDPADYGRAPGDPDRPVRTLAFGPDGEGLVTFLVYPPDELVLVVRIQWLG